MGKTFDLNYLGENESEQILNVLEKDFQVRLRERNRLSKIKKKIHDEDRRARVLSDQEEFNDTCCIRCFRRFMLLLIPKFRCYACGFNVCGKCCSFFLQFRDFVCITCQMEKDVMAQSCDWFYETVQRKFRQSGSAKVVRRLSASFKDRGKELPMTRKMRASVLSAFPDGKIPMDDRMSTPESSGDEAVVDVRKVQSETSVMKRKDDGSENSQKEVLRKMKSFQITRFHERMQEAMDKVAAALLQRFPHGLSTPADRVEFRNFIHKSNEELAVILKNFAQILSITIESHNLAMGRTSEDVQVDIQYILQDEVEGIVSRRIDVNFDDSASFITDEGSRTGQGNSVEWRLAVVILRKILDDHKEACGGRQISLEEEELMRTFDAIFDTASNSSLKARSSGFKRQISSTDSPREVDPDLLSISNVSWGNVGHLARPRSGGSSLRSAGSGSGGSHWLATGRPVAEASMRLARAERSRISDRYADDLSDLSNGSEAELANVSFDGAAFSDISGTDYVTPWAGTSLETEKKFLLQHLHQQQGGIPPELRESDSSRVTRVSRSLVAANQSVTGAAMELQSSAGQLEAIMKQLSSLDHYIDSVSAKYVPTTALRVTSDHGVKAAARVLHSLPTSSSGDPNRRQLEEDVDNIQARMGTHVRTDSSWRSSETTRGNDSRTTRRDSSGNSEVIFGYRPPSRNALDEYKST